MKFELLTKNDFSEIKETLLQLTSEIKSLKQNSPLSEKWLDNQDLCELLHISKRTLQNYRDHGTIPFSQIGGKIYYKASDVEKLLNKHYVHPGHF